MIRPRPVLLNSTIRQHRDTLWSELTRSEEYNKPRNFALLQLLGYFHKIFEIMKSGSNNNTVLIFLALPLFPFLNKNDTITFPPFLIIVINSIISPFNIITNPTSTHIPVKLQKYIFPAKKKTPQLLKPIPPYTSS